MATNANMTSDALLAGNRSCSGRTRYTTQAGGLGVSRPGNVSPTLPLFQGGPATTPFFLLPQMPRRSKGKFLYSAVSNPQDCSKRFTFTLYSVADRHNRTRLLWEAYNHAGINARRLFVKQIHNTNIHTHTRAHIHKHIHTCAHKHAQTCTGTHSHAQTHTDTHSTHTDTHRHTHTHTHTHTY